jgi:hypothetical protein
MDYKDREKMDARRDLRKRVERLEKQLKKKKKR